MSPKPESAPALSRSDKFKAAALEAGCDEDEGRWEERLRKVAKQKPSDPPGA